MLKFMAGLFIGGTPGYFIAALMILSKEGED